MFTTKLKVAVAAISMALLSPGITSAASPAAGSAGLSANTYNGSGTQFHAMFANFGTDLHPIAHLDVALDTAAVPTGTNIYFTVFDLEGVQVAEFAVPTNSNGFASSAWAPPPYRNLFRLTNGHPGTVRASGPAGVLVGSAVLQQRGTGNRLVLGVPQTLRDNGTPLGAGRIFPIAVPDVPAAALLIGNVSGVDVNVDVFLGTRGGDGLGKYNNLRLKSGELWHVDLEQVADENAHLVVSASDNVIVQLVLGDERVTAVTCLPAG